MQEEAKFVIEVSAPVKAEKTDRPDDPEVKSTPTIEGVTIKEACSQTGWIRSITVNGRCYKQMCCNGQWLYYYKDTPQGRVWCTCDLGQSWTVCGGYILPCR